MEILMWSLAEYIKLENNENSWIKQFWNLHSHLCCMEILALEIL